MISQEIFFNLFESQVRQLAAAQGLNEADVDRVIRVFSEAMKNPYMDERLIYHRMVESPESAE